MLIFSSVEVIKGRQLVVAPRPPGFVRHHHFYLSRYESMMPTATYFRLKRRFFLLPLRCSEYYHSLWPVGSLLAKVAKNESAKEATKIH